MLNMDDLELARRHVVAGINHGKRNNKNVYEVIAEKSTDLSSTSTLEVFAWQQQAAAHVGVALNIFGMAEGQKKILDIFTRELFKRIHAETSKIDAELGEAIEELESLKD